MSDRDVGLGYLEVLRLCLEQNIPFPANLKKYLMGVCDRAAADDPDPLGIKKKKGGQSNTRERFTIAKRVHEEITKQVNAGVPRGKARFDAYKFVAEEFGRPHADGHGDAISKIYAEFKTEIERAERIYASARVAPEHLRPRIGMGGANPQSWSFAPASEEDLRADAAFDAATEGFAKRHPNFAVTPPKKRAAKARRK